MCILSDVPVVAVLSQAKQPQTRSSTSFLASMRRSRSPMQRMHSQNLLSCWFCRRDILKKDYFWCSGGCGYEICRTCLHQEGSAVTLKCIRNKWHCDECANKYWAGVCVYCLDTHVRLKPCDYCKRQFCVKDSFWCQVCNYNICRFCQEEELHGLRWIDGRWTCASCVDAL